MADPKRFVSNGTNYHHFSEKFISSARYSIILERLVGILKQKKFSQNDVMQDSILQQILKYIFKRNDQPKQEFVISLREWFLQHPIDDVLERPYTCSAWVALCIYLIKIQTHIQDQDKLKAMLNVTGYRDLIAMYQLIYGKDLDYVSVRKARANQHFNDFTNILRTTADCRKTMLQFIGTNCSRDYSNETDLIINCIKNFV